MGIFTSSKTEVWIAPSVVAEPADAAAYAALTWVRVGKVENPGEIGDQFSDVTFDDLGDGRTQHLKGQADGGTMQLVVGYDDTDEGQDALRAAQQDPSTALYPIKVVYANKQNLTGTGGTHYFGSKVMGGRQTPGAANSVVRQTFMVGVNTKLTSVASTAGA